MRHQLTNVLLHFLFTTLCAAALFAGVTAYIVDACMKLPPDTLPITALRGALLVSVWLLVAANIPSLVAAVVGGVRAKLAR